MPALACRQFSHCARQKAQQDYSCVCKQFRPAPCPPLHAGNFLIVLDRKHSKTIPVCVSSLDQHHAHPCMQAIFPCARQKAQQDCSCICKQFRPAPCPPLHAGNFPRVLDRKHSKTIPVCVSSLDQHHAHPCMQAIFPCARQKAQQDCSCICKQFRPAPCPPLHAGNFPLCSTESTARLFLYM